MNMNKVAENLKKILKGLNSKKKEESCYMMATIAKGEEHDFSRNTPQLCRITGEDEENFIGNWVEGYGYTDIKFPKNTTRELTEEEHKKYNGSAYSMNGNLLYLIKTKPNLVPREPFIARTKNSEYCFGKASRNGIRTITKTGGGDFPSPAKGKVTFLEVGKMMEIFLIEEESRWFTTRVISME